jgi:serine/threonine protein kinase
MELVPTNLEKHIVAQKVSCEYPFMPQVAIDIMSQIALGMDYLHRQGVVHHDLKPNNILISPTQTLNYVMKGMWR